MGLTPKDGAPYPRPAVNQQLSRRDLLRAAAMTAAALSLPGAMGACAPRQRIGTPAPDAPDDDDRRRLTGWAGSLRAEKLTQPPVPIGRAAARVGELAVGTPYVAFTLEEYLKAGGSP